jgi:hypothetical protein
MAVEVGGDGRRRWRSEEIEKVCTGQRSPAADNGGRWEEGGGARRQRR